MKDLTNINNELIKIKKTYSDKIAKLEKQKIGLIEKRNKRLISNFEKIGLFKLNENEIYGLLIDALKSTESRGIWNNQGKLFCEQLNKKNGRNKKNT